MRIELPDFKRCCCCIPLRYGLLVWTYIRTLYLLPIIVTISRSIYRDFQRDSAVENTLESGFLIVLVLDVIFNIVFIVGGHAKIVRLLEVQYRYNIVSVVMFTLLLSAIIVDVLIREYRLFFILGLFKIIIINICVCIIGIVMQVYIILLTRSEIRKLANNLEFRFENNAAEAQCIAHIADDLGSTDPNYHGVPPA